MATNQQIRDYARRQGFTPNAQGAYEVNNDQLAGSIYDHAKSMGYSANELDTAFGWDSGTANNWITRNKRDPLVGPNSDAPAGSKPAGITNQVTQPGMLAGPGANKPPMTQAQGTGGSNAAMLQGWYADYLKSNPTMTTPERAGVTQWEVDPSKQTVQGQLEGMLKKDSPLMTMAQTRADQQMNRRGLMSSSMAVQAGQAALYDAAVPIATSDAQMYGRAAEVNTGQANETARFNTSQGNAWGAADLDRRAQGAMFQADLAEKGRQADLSAQTQLNIAGMDYDIADRRLSADDRNFLATFGLEQQKLSAQLQQFEKQYGLERDKMTAEQRQFYDGLKLEESKLNQQAEQFNTEWANRFSLAEFEKAGKIELAQMDADNRLQLAEIEARYKNDIAREQNISNAWGTMLTEIGKIQGNPELEAGAKATAIQNAINAFQGYSAFFKKLSGNAIDIGDLLQFGVTMPSGDGSGGTSSGGPAAEFDGDVDGDGDMDTADGRQDRGDGFGLGGG